jgi:Spy/CpxP family protein refolding chaperone
MRKAILPAFAFAVSLSGAFAQDLDQDQSQSANSAPYAGFQGREVKSLSEQDITELRRGGGWGLALPAELSGLPGPAHLLELQEELSLSAQQVAKIEEIFVNMQAEAITFGERLIEAEAELSIAFESPDLDPVRLRQLVEVAAAARADLRFTHLSRHLLTPNLLTAEQIKQYNVARGYADDPCASVPDGHDPDMWRRHNGCG